MKRGSQCACCCNNNVNAFLTCTTRSTLVCTRLIIAPLIYSLYFPPWWWLVPPPCLHSLRLGVPLFLSLARYMQLIGRKKSASDVKFFDTRSDTRTYEGSRGMRRRNKTDTEEDGFGRRGRRRFYASYNHSYLLRYKQKYARILPSISRAYHYHRCRVSGINVKCVECVQFGDGLRKKRREGVVIYIGGYNAIVCGRIHMRLIVAYYEDEDVQTRGMFIG